MIPATSHVGRMCEKDADINSLVEDDKRNKATVNEQDAELQKVEQENSLLRDEKQQLQNMATCWCTNQTLNWTAP